jgi:hypothetical protein
MLAGKLWWKPRYQRHELTGTRNTHSLVFCVLALLDALDQGDSLKTLGLHVKMTHDDPRLYLISHASLARRGLPIGPGPSQRLPHALAGA